MALSPLAPLIAVAAAEHAEKAPPVIDVDGTLLIQFFLFLLMYFLLRSLLFRPYLQMRSQRSEKIEGAEAEAHRMEERAKEIGADYERRFRAARLRCDEERGRLRGEGLEYERVLLTKTRELAQGRLKDTRELIRRETEVAKTELDREALPLARRIASQVLGREVA